jgi:5'-3' exonuclease
MNIIIDGNYSLHKNFHVFRHFRKGDLFTGTLFGMLRDISIFKDKYNVENDEIHVTWDSRSFRKDIMEGYKANRVIEEGHNAYSDYDLVIETLQALGIHQYRSEGYESDDLIYTLALSLPGKKIIFSKDRDLLQCLSHETFLLFSFKDPEYGIESFQEQYGFKFSRDNFVLWKSIVGDSSDNVKGISRFPKKDAVALLNGGIVSPRAKSMLAENASTVEKNKEVFYLKEVSDPGHFFSERNEELLSALREKTGIKNLF